jgi:hypothetical protein
MHHPKFLYKIPEVLLELINIEKICSLVGILLGKEHHIVQAKLTALHRLIVSDNTTETLDFNVLRTLPTGSFEHLAGEEGIVSVERAGNTLEDLIVHVSQRLPRGNTE